MDGPIIVPVKLYRVSIMSKSINQSINQGCAGAVTICQFER